MATKKKLLQAAAGSAGGEALNVEDVFSTYLWTGTGSEQTVTNGINLAGEEGIVWTKARNAAVNNEVFYKTANSPSDGTSRLSTNLTDAENNGYTGNLAVDFLSDGFSFGSTLNTSGRTFASWTFRKAPKFFDVVTWTGDGTGARTISHNLGATPGSIIRKKTSGTERWYVWHRSVSNDLSLNETTAASYIAFNATDPTSTEFTVSASGNISGETHVAYLFAHNDGDGDFGSTADQDIIKCGSYTGNGSNDGPEIDLGFEPQFVITKNISSAANWNLYDSMRGMGVGVVGGYLDPNTTDVEGSHQRLAAQSTGFKLQSSSTEVNSSGHTFIYIAIRRGPMAVPTDATEVFAIDTSDSTDPAYDSSFPVDMAILRNIGGAVDNFIATRLTSSERMSINSTAAASSVAYAFDYNNGIVSGGSTNTSLYSWMWRRAPNFFDVVAYAGAGAAQTINHNLGVAPEMIWVKVRDFATSWTVFHKDLGIDKWLNLDNTNTVQTASGLWGTSDPDATTFGLGLNTGLNNGSGRNYIAYLFASLDGVSKVGSYTGTGQSGGNITVDCGFTSGARFVLIKRTDAAGSWWVADTERGLVSGNDNLLDLSSTGAEITNYNMVEPSSSGFIVNGSGVGGDNSWNDAGGNYIFYAIA